MQSARMNVGPVVGQAGEAGMCGILQMGTRTQMGAHTKGPQGEIKRGLRLRLVNSADG